METTILDFLDALTDSFVNPQKRTFVGYLAAAGAIAFVAVLLSANTDMRSGIRHASKTLFDRAIWWSASAKADYKILVINRAVMMLVSPVLLSQIVLAAALFEYLHVLMGGRATIGTGLPGWSIVACFTLALFLCDDLSKYLVHRALHRWAILWPFHKVHHSAETLTPLTVYRTHPVEGVLFALRASVVQAVTIAVFVFFFGERVDLASVLGANVFLFVFNVTGSNLRHSHVRIRYGKLVERIFVSPAQHHIHHSMDVRHHDKNFGAVLAVWDWIGGSLHLSQRNQELTYGLQAEENRAVHSLRQLYLTPLRDAAEVLLAALSPENLRMNIRAFQKSAAPSVRVLALTVCLLSGIWPASDARAADELNIYSHRQPFLINPFIEAYTEATGVAVNIVFASKGLAQRLQAEQKNSPADIVLTVDVGRLSVYADKDLLAPVESAVLRRNVPAHLRDAKNRWFAFSKRARVVAISKERVKPGEITRIEDLADEKWAGRICSRPGSHVYNRALTASLIAAHGEEAAEAWVKGFVANLARRPQGNDRAQVKAIYEGVCDIAIINNYYFGKLKFSDIPEQRDWADAIDLVFPNQDDRGTHINISGGGVAKYSKHKEAAVHFLEYLSEATAQSLYGDVNFEYPVNPAVEPSAFLRSLGAFKEDQLPISRIAELAPAAQKIIDRAGW